VMVVLPSQLLTAIHTTLRETSTKPPQDSNRTQAENQSKFDHQHARWGSISWDANLTDDEVWQRICFIPFFAGVEPIPDDRVARTIEIISDYRVIGELGWLDGEHGQAWVAEGKSYEAYKKARERDPTLPYRQLAYWNEKENKGPTIAAAASKLVARQQSTGRSLLSLLVPERFRAFTDGDLQSLFRNFQSETGYPFITSFHALMDLGVPLVKPDTMLVRTAVRLGLVDASAHLPHRTGLKVTSEHAKTLGQRPAFVWPLQRVMSSIARETEKNVREVDWLFAKMGMQAQLDEGREIVICDDVPKCELCLARPICAYAREYRPMPVFKPLKVGKSKSRRIKARDMSDA
jgi:hypothetical protein